MGFLGSLFGNKKETDALRMEIDRVRSDLLKNTLGVKGDINQIIAILADFDNDLAAIKEALKYDDARDDKTIEALEGISSKSEKSMNDLRARIAGLERIAANVKVMGRLSLHNYDAIKSVNEKLKKLDNVDRIDAVEKAIREHISLTPESVVTKDEYLEEIKFLKKRLEAIEKHEMFSGLGENIIISSERKRAKKRSAPSD